MSRSNALKLGVFSRERLILGEDEGDYRKLYDQLLTELNPQGVIETVLVDQIVGDVWRLRRVENAETHQHNVFQGAFYAQARESMSDDELELFRRYVYGFYYDTLTPPRKDPRSLELRIVDTPNLNDISRYRDKDKLDAILRKLDRPIDIMRAGYAGIANSDRDSALSNIDRMRRALIRDIIQKHEALYELQERRRTIDGSLEDGE